ncbi:MAG: nucleoside-diphosphate kinase [Deltaproteobacteria bacterium]|nr:nucleoside-diphosphate kinase [Deltaproteobacteria bacterium]
MLERTLSIIKPNAVERGLVGKILARFEDNHLKIVATKMVWLSRPKAMEFYAVHKERPFFKSLVDFMVSGPVVVSVLEGEDAVKRHRDVMGATDPGKAAPGTIRKDFGESIEKNASHGSDSLDNAKVEISHFFSGLELQDYARR